LQMFGVMMRKGIMPNVVTYSCLIWGLCLDGQVERALGFFARVMHKGFEPDSIAYVTTISYISYSIYSLIMYCTDWEILQYYFEYSDIVRWYQRKVSDPQFNLAPDLRN
jgi:pentatricopeptide repeat protein